MKLFKRLFILAMLVVVSISCCKDDDDKPELKKFPYFSCIINGNQFFHANGNWLCPSQTFYYYPNGYLDAPPGTISMQGKDCSSADLIGIGLENFQISFDTIHLQSAINVGSCISYFVRFLDGNPIKFDEIENGYLKFNEFSDKSNTSNGIVSGTFEFTVHNSEID